MLTREIQAIRKMPLLPLPVRSSRLSVGDAAVLLSPGSTLTRAQVEDLGPVDAIVAPNLFHTEGMAQAAAVFPGAELWGPPGVREKAPDLKWTGIFGADPWPHEAALSAHVIGGMPAVNEVVLVDRVERTAHVADLIFNLGPTPGLGPAVILGIFGTKERFAMSRLLGTMVKDKGAFRASVEMILGLDFDRLVPAHGGIVAAGAKEKLRAAFAERGYA